MRGPKIEIRRPRDDRPQTFLFADLCGFTEYTSRHGDEPAAQLALAFHERARELAAQERCRVVKSIGDAVMIHSSSPQRALRAARRIVALSELEGFPLIRAGLDVGPAVEHGGDWYGTTVNTAARVAAAAMPGELVLTERARNAVAEETDLEMVGLGVWHLKGLPGMHLHVASGA